MSAGWFGGVHGVDRPIILPEEAQICTKGLRPAENCRLSRTVIPNEVRDLHSAADCRSLTSFGMTVLERRQFSAGRNPFVQICASSGRMMGRSTPWTPPNHPADITGH